jgi:hypothetical protein
MAENDDKPKVKRERGANTKVGKSTEKRKIAKEGGREFASAGRYTVIGTDGTIADDAAYRNKLRAFKGQTDALLAEKTAAGLFSDTGLGFADIADSNNIGYYSYEFPVDALELPASRAEELRFYRLAYDRDPIVGRAIDMHTELPLSKMELGKPKCSSPDYADYVFDFYQKFVTDTRLFQVLIDMCREFWTIGESFMFVEKPEEVTLGDVAQKIVDKGQKGAPSEPTKESEFHAPLGGTSGRILEYLQPEKRSAWAAKRGDMIDEFKAAGLGFDFDEDPAVVAAQVDEKRAALNKQTRKIAKMLGISARKLASAIVASDNQKALFSKIAKIISRVGGPDLPSEYPLQVTAEISKVAQPPEDEPPAPAPDPDAPPAPEGEAAPGEGAPLGDEGLGDIAGAPPMGGGGGGGGGGMMTPPDLAGDVKGAIAQGASIAAQRELMDLKHLLDLLKRKKEVLEELQKIRKEKKKEMDLFAHLTNPDYEGPARIQILPPEQIEITNEGTLVDGPTIYYKPPEQQKQAYLEDPEVPADIKDKIQTEGKIPLNADPFKGSYIIHFARKKSGYELHGRSILQRCIRGVIYREKLRQVQNTIASRNMTPKTLVIAPEIPPAELIALRAHIDEAKADPDYSVVLNYEARWDEIGSEGRLLSLDAEWAHTNADLAIGLGLSPELLIGEGMYAGNRIQLEILNVSYLQFRDLLTGIIEDQIFKPIAMEKGFYEMDAYGRPRWIYPKVTFSRMALRDSGDLYDMLFNLYAKGSLPVDIIYEFLNIDPEDAEARLKEDLFTVKDAKFTQMTDTIYNALGDYILMKTDVGKKVAKGLGLQQVEMSDVPMEPPGGPPR